MDTTVPYHAGMLLGRSVNMKTMQPGYMLIEENITPTELKVSQTTSRFFFATTLKDVCDVLGIPPEYALKVKAGIPNFKNELVEACLKDLGKKDQFRIIFRVTYLEQKRYISLNVPVETAADSESCKGNSSLQRSLSDKSRELLGTHWVKAKEVGNELVTVMTVSCADTKKLNKLRTKLSKRLQADSGQLDSPKMKALSKLAIKIDKKLPEEDNADVGLDIQYAFFSELDKYPASMSGMVKTLDSFMDQCVGWTEGSKHSQECEVEACAMRCQPGIDREAKTTVNDSEQKFADAAESGCPQTVEYNPPRKTCEESSASSTDDDINSFTILDYRNCFYNLRITLQLFEKDVTGSCSSPALGQSKQTTYTVLEKLFELLETYPVAVQTTADFMSSKHCFLKIHFDEGTKVLKSIKDAHLLVLETVEGLDFVCIPTENILENVITTNPMAIVTDFIENVTSKLPSGNDIDLLMFGKTGHGKSSTGNSILGQDLFHCSESDESETNDTGVGWVEIDGRTIKVVDTPGVCDTNIDASSFDLAIEYISKAIAYCPEGFHALLLIIRFPTRMTEEEKKAIELLKRVLGENILRSHCIVVITYGDEFDRKMAAKKTTFEEWCRNRTGFLKNLFEECNYRCVLFNNSTTDPKVKKAQLIKLVSTVDSLQDSGTRYTNSFFEFAQRERQRIISETMMPEANEDFMKYTQLIIEILNDLSKDTNEPARYKDELSRLEEKVDNLHNKITATENWQSILLAEAILALFVTLHADMADNSPRPDSPVESVGATPNEIIPKREDLVARRDEIQKCYNYEITPAHNTVVNNVAEEVKKKVKQETQCFPGSSVVMLSNRKYVTLEELSVGDEVLVRDKTGCLSFDTVYMFGHQESDATSEFLALKTASQTVYVTSGHYVYCVQDGTEMCVSAENVHVGDHLLVATGEGLVPQSVQAVTYERKRGLFAPFTNSGNIVVDGALMSCYIDVLPAAMCHTLLWPVRQLYRVSPRLLSYINGPPSKHPVSRLAKLVLKLM